MIGIYTVISDDRILDAHALLKSIARFKKFSINIIPFEEITPKLKELAGQYNANLVTPDPVWDNLGKSIFANQLYRPNVLAWKYFRKLNALSHSSDNPFLFLDANTVLVDDPTPIFDKLNESEMLFGARAMRGRNFSDWGKDFVNILNLHVGEGFNAGFWGGINNPFTSSVFEFMSKHGDKIKPMLTISPEQSVISLALALGNVSPKLISEVDNGYANMVSAEAVAPEKIIISGLGSVRYDDRIVLALKWTGRNITLPHEHPAEVVKRAILAG